MTDRPPHELRMAAELDELEDRRARLQAFLQSDASEGLHAVDRELMRRQDGIMQQYAQVLQMRIRRSMRARGL